MQTISLTPPPAYTSPAPQGSVNAGAIRPAPASTVTSSRPSAAGRPANDARARPTAAEEPPTTDTAAPSTLDPPVASADPLPAAMEALTVG